ncbi:unnamed protein product [Amaranthus hypochondriacus]
MVATSLMRIVSPCWKPLVEGENSSKHSNGRFSGLLWHKDFGTHANGDFSMAVIQANNLLEDHSQVESGPLGLLDDGPHGTFVGIYDGHGGPETARFVCDNLFKNIKKYTSESEGMSRDVIKKAYLATEEEFMSLVKELWLEKPQIASVGACCLVGVICCGHLYIANAGDSRVVLGKLDQFDKCVKAIQLSSDHNASVQSVREDLQNSHPNDPQIVVLKHKVWRVKGLIQVSRSIGDAYLKKAEFNKAPLLTKFRINDPFEKPIMTAEPSISVQKILPEDHFLIFASDGLWDLLTNQEVVDIVNSNSRHGIAKKLVKTALIEAAKRREMRYSDLKKVERGVRRHFHDDITVIVLFLDTRLISRNTFRGPFLSLKGAGYSSSDIDSS